MSNLKSILWDIVKRIISWCAATVLFLGIAVKGFLNFPAFAVGVATIPVSKWIDEHFNITPVIRRLISLAIFFALLYVSWHVAEVIIILVVLALFQESFLLLGIIKRKLLEREMRLVA